MTEAGEWDSDGFEAWRDYQREEMAALKDSDAGLRALGYGSGNSGVAARAEDKEIVDDYHDR